MRRALCIALALLMLLTVAPLTVFAEETETHKAGDVIEFGSYPQSEVTDATLKAALTAKAGSTDGWTSYNYYINSKQSDYMKYTDVEYDGAKYRGVYFTQYRPYWTDSSSSTYNSYQDDNGYSASTIYWFKYEPMKWQVLSYDSTTGEAVVLSKSIIDSQQYYYGCENIRTIDGATVYPNNYEHSDIRTWLNDTFYNTAFGTSEKNAIVATTLDNSANNQNYDSNSTTDNVWLLSYSEAQNTAYGFISNTTRQATGTAYALCQGTSKNSSNGCSYWCLRSASVHHYYFVCYVGDGGSVSEFCNVNGTSYSVRPALTLNLTHNWGKWSHVDGTNTHTRVCANDSTHTETESCEFTDEVVASTCIEKGYTVHTCNDCGYSYADTETAANGHNYGEWISNGNGTHTKECSVCAVGTDGHAETENCTVTGKQTKAPTCTAKGETTYTCSECDYSYTEEIAALGHSFGEWVTVTEPTTTEPGIAKRTCSACGTEEEKTLDRVSEKNRTIQFVNIDKMCYVLDDDGEDYVLYNTGTIKWYSDKPLNFTVYTYSNFNYQTVIVKVNGVEISPDADGVYTIPAGTDLAVVTVVGAVEDSDGTKISFWEKIIRFFVKLFSAIAELFGK